MNWIVIFAALSGALSVGAGAFGAHGASGRAAPGRTPMAGSTAPSTCRAGVTGRGTVCFPTSDVLDLSRLRWRVDIDQTWRLSRRKVKGPPAVRRRQAMRIGRPRAHGFEVRDRGRVSRHQLDNLGAHFDRAVA